VVESPLVHAFSLPPFVSPQIEIKADGMGIFPYITKYTLVKRHFHPKIHFLLF